MRKLEGKRGRSVWTEEQVVGFRERYADGRITVREIAREWKVGEDSVRKMLRGATYAVMEEGKGEEKWKEEAEKSLERLKGMLEEGKGEESRVGERLRKLGLE